jgi:hypothetical protein
MLPCYAFRGDGVKDTRKKMNEEAMLEQKAKEEALKNGALDFYRQLIERGFKPFYGASIDFHQKRGLVVFIPGESPIIAVVKHEELLDFLIKNNIRRILIDAPFPSRAELLMEVSKAGIEVYFIRRPVLSSWYYLPLPILTRLCTIATAIAISSMLFKFFELTLL